MHREPWYRAGVIAIVVCAIAPIVASIAALAPLPDTIPLHFDLDGNVNRWGSKWELVPVGGLMALVNALMLVFYVKAEALDRMNLMNAPGPNKATTGRIILIACSVILDVIFLCCIVAIVASIGNAS